MAIIGFIGFLLLCVIVAYKFNEKFVTVFPVCIGIWIFILYILAFFQKLYWIDYIGGGVFLFMVFYIISRKDDFKKKKALILCNSTFVMLIIYLLLWFINKNRMAWSGDELGVWAIEVKSLFFVNGFADKYKNVALGYGDYHPGQMLFEWWICHFNSQKFNEGLMYVGYNFLYASFLMPTLGILDKRKNKGTLILDGIIIFGLIMLLPSCVDILSYNFLSVELLISVIYANLLYIAMEKPDNNNFYCLKTTVYLFLLMLLKNTSIIYALLFLILIFILKHKDKGITCINGKSFAFMFLGSCIPIAIWKIYCRIWDRTNYFTTTSENLLKDMVNNTFQFSPNTRPLVCSFFKSLFVEPLHSDKTIFLDMSVILCVILTICLLYFAFKKDKDSVKRRVIIAHYLLSVVVLLTGLLFMHVFIFQEPQYMSTSNMIYSISRYVEPIFLGNIVFAFMIIIDGCKNMERKMTDILFVIIPIFICANYGTLYHQIINYSPLKESILTERTEVSNQNIELVREIEDRKIFGRVLYVVNNDEYFDSMAQRRLSYIVSPASIVYQFVDMAIVEKEQNYSDILWMINKNNCQYVFFKGISEEYLDLFQFSGVDNKENVLLKIERDENQNIYFKPVD